MNTMPKNLNYIWSSDMTYDEKEKHPEAKTTSGYLQKVDAEKAANEWWRELNREDKRTILSIPNFDKDIFREITGIDVDEVS